ncbi:hypothetical protein Pmani_009864 [Petrolisthes manimaculis]|uniref:Uncharacterized protein n=1 Tax=Petrolisthes manimaculis TaxID=1843537 RepID=A0AAE1UGA6_9EUCA|nr:hypothetical protein Pmani_009864 [Petrolisthes manimaculis]
MSKKVLRGASLTVGEKEARGKQDKYSFHGKTTHSHQNGSQPEKSKEEEIHGHIKNREEEADETKPKECLPQEAKEYDPDETQEDDTEKVKNDET